MQDSVGWLAACYSSSLTTFFVFLSFLLLLCVSWALYAGWFAQYKTIHSHYFGVPWFHTPATSSWNTSMELEFLWHTCWWRYGDPDRSHDRRAGVKVRERIERDWTFKPFPPSVIMGKVRSLTNKTDELTAMVNSQRAYRECSLLGFSETWLNGNILTACLN